MHMETHIHLFIHQLCVFKLPLVEIFECLALALCALSEQQCSLLLFFALMSITTTENKEGKLSQKMKNLFYAKTRAA